MHRVLIVEDDADINTALAESLRLAGFDVVGTLTGTAGLAEARRRRPDIVLLDQMLPDIDGIEVCRRLREAPETRDLPIVFLTARSGEEARIKGLASGADDYVVKPFSVRELVLRIQGLLRRATTLPDIRLPAAWLHCREQFRVFDTYAKIHLERGEWRECQELCRSILSRCEEALSHAERCLLFTRLARCAESLGDAQEERAWRERAHAEARLA
jgi:DNA-binding response OmpR family regulator